MPTIYEQLGEGVGIGNAVDAFYDRLLADAQLAPYFAATDMARLRQHTAALLSTVTGGPASYQGRELGVAHAHLGITEADFLRVVEHLVTVLEGARVSSASIDAVVSALAMHKNEIVTAGAPAERSADGRGR